MVMAMKVWRGSDRARWRRSSLPRVLMASRVWNLRWNLSDLSRSTTDAVLDKLCDERDEAGVTHQDGEEVNFSEASRGKTPKTGPTRPSGH